MNSTLLICLATIWSFGFAYQVNERETLPPKLPLRPGDLLRSLDELTSDAQVIYTPLNVEPTKSADRRVYDDDSVDPGSQDNYDKAYEDFVSKYFAQGEEDLESDDEDEKSVDGDGAVAYESSNETDDVESQKQEKSSKKCERVEIDDQNCLVCEDSKTNEKSKTCSYSSESKPKSYGFSKERSTKRSSGDDDDDSAEVGKSLKREATLIRPSRRTSIKALLTPVAAEDSDDTSKCTRKREDSLICYYCGTAKEYTRECMTDKNYPKKHRLNESSKKDSRTKKVYKRMVTYSYKNGAEPKIEKNTYAAFKRY